MQHAITIIVFLSAVIQSTTQSTLVYGFDHPQDTARTKVWWFHGETVGTHEGITADLEAFRQQGVGGVVYYDQVHGSGEGASSVFSPEWWDELLFSAKEAKRLGLSFEANCSNGYVAGGRWITPDRSMQRIAVGETLMNGGQTARLALPPCPRGWYHDVAVLAVAYRPELTADSRLLNIVPTGRPDSALVFDFGRSFTARSITYEAKAQGKARTSSMQVPPTHQPLDQPDPTRFFGCGYSELPDIGVLEVSDDGTSYRPVCNLRPRYRNLGGVKHQTIAFPATRGRYFRLTLHGRNVPLSNVVVSARASVDNWEAKASLVSDFIDADDHTPIYNKVETIQPADIIDLTDRLTADGTLSLPDTLKGQWLVMRFVSVTTGGHTKHGRKEALGLECDKLSVEGARLQWRSYVKPVIDSIRQHGGALEGICMDSHEAGPQNWTVGFEREFHHLRGYDVLRWLPVMAGFVVGSAEQSDQVLRDVRRTISDLITDRYYGEMNRLCRAEGLTLTAQAVGGALCMSADAIEVKKLVDKPQAEFWGYQTEGNYDIKDCSSAAHLYGKQIASGEAFTDITYKHSLADIKNLADYAFAFGINELVVCASAYQPWVQKNEEFKINTANGRQYVLNRLNTLWPMSRPFWDYQARCSWMLRQGKPVSDICIYLGDDVPMRILGHRLPDLPQGYDFDAFTTDALKHRMTVKDGRIVLPDSTSYGMMILPPDGQLPEDVRELIDSFRRQGVAIYEQSAIASHEEQGAGLDQAISKAGLTPDVVAPAAKRLYFCHRRTATEDIYFLNNHSDQDVTDRFRFRTTASSAALWHPVTGNRTPLVMATEGDYTTVNLTLHARESFFIVLSRKDTKSLESNTTNRPITQHPSSIDQSLEVDGPWTVTFDTAMGGPSEPVILPTLTDWTESSDPHIKYYAGTAIYHNTFTLKRNCPAKEFKGSRSGTTYSLNLQLRNAAAEVIVNGRSAGVVWCSPWKVDITRLLKRGQNKIELRVANTLWNRLVGDAQLPEAKRTTWLTHPLAKPDDKLQPSGLTGCSIEIAR